MSFEELYNELSSKSLKQIGESVKITNGLFKEEDKIKVFEGLNELYFCIDKEGMKELLQNVVNKVKEIEKTNGFERMIDTFNIIQSEIGKYFGNTPQMTRMQYYMLHGKDIGEDSKLCSLSEIKGKGIAECAEKASVANNLLLSLNKLGLFPYEVSYMNSLVEMPNEKGGHAFLSFPKINQLGEKSFIMYDVTNPEIISWNDNFYNYPAIYSLSEEEYNLFLQGGSFDNSHFVANFPVKEKRIYSGFYVEKKNKEVDEVQKLREEYIKMMSGDDSESQTISNDDSDYSDHMTLPTQSSGMHRR